MDVTCERCGTEYDFDETLVSYQGTSVKCTQCGHLFKVFRPGGASEPGPDASWRVRRSDGSVETVPTLRDLQRRIIQGALTPDDEISASDQPWKRLGDIAELESFFAPASSAPVPGSSSHDATVAFEVRPTSAERPEASRSSRAASRREKRTLLGVGVEAASASRDRESPEPVVPPEGEASPRGADAPSAEVAFPPPDSAGTSVADEPPATARGRDSEPAAAAERKGAEPSSAETASAPQGSAPSTGRRRDSTSPRERRPAVEREVTALRLSLADGAPPARRRRRVGVFVAAGLVALVVVAIWQRDRLFGSSEDRIAPALEAAGEALARDELGSYREAVAQLARATQTAPRDARAFAALARAHAAWAQALAFEALDQDALAEADPASASRARRARRESSEHARAARQSAERAVGNDPSLGEASLALADALRLAGDLTAAEQHLERAREAHGVPADELHRVSALLAAARAEGDFAAAAREARLAVEAAPNVIRNRVLLARALLASGDVDGARRQLAEAGAEHEMVRPLLGRIDSEGAESSEEATPDAPLGEPTPTATQEAAEDAPADYASTMRHANALLVLGDFAGAREGFERALRLRPGDADALAGLGQMALKAGNPSGAISRFRQATQRGHTESYVGLGDAYRRAGDPAQAVRAYEKYLERSPRGSQAAIARRRIDELGRPHSARRAGDEEPQQASPGGASTPAPAPSAPAPTGQPSGVAPAPVEPGAPLPAAPAPPSEPAPAPSPAPPPPAPEANAG